ncbi:hypothetical protein VZT92_024876 [Zoarces viviparus]|uniref:Uncharacterized protein n=1 Tax=Zoarces viviparus TaxID=48416 RepID=A0AAW1E3E6_ZOAVI
MRAVTAQKASGGKGELLISTPVDSFDQPGPPFSVLCLFASWLWKEMGPSASRLSFEVLWLSSKRSAVPAAICEGAASSSHPSLHFPSMTERGRSQEWRWGWHRNLVRVGWTRQSCVYVREYESVYGTLKTPTSVPSYE